MNDKCIQCNALMFNNSLSFITAPVFSPIFRATGKSVFQTGKAARLKILFHPEVEVAS